MLREFKQRIAHQLVQKEVQRRETMFNKQVASKYSSRSDMAIGVDSCEYMTAKTLTRNQHHPTCAMYYLVMLQIFHTANSMSKRFHGEYMAVQLVKRPFTSTALHSITSKMWWKFSQRTWAQYFKRWRIWKVERQQTPFPTWSVQVYAANGLIFLVHSSNVSVSLIYQRLKT